MPFLGRCIPFLLPLYAVVYLLTCTAFVYYPTGMKFYFAWVIVLYAMVIPVLSLGLLRALGRVSDWRIDERRERWWPLLIGTLCYVLCAVTLARIPSAVFLRKFMLAAACCEGMCLVVSFYWKISLHLTAMGAAVALFVVMSVADPGVRSCRSPPPSSAPGHWLPPGSTWVATTLRRSSPGSAADSASLRWRFCSFDFLRPSACGCYTHPWASMALATFMKPPMLAPTT